MDSHASLQALEEVFVPGDKGGDLLGLDADRTAPTARPSACRRSLPRLSRWIFSASSPRTGGELRRRREDALILKLAEQGTCEGVNLGSVNYLLGGTPLRLHIDAVQAEGPWLMIPIHSPRPLAAGGLTGFAWPCGPSGA